MPFFRGAPEVAFEAENARFESIPEQGGYKSARNKSEGHNGDIAGDSVGIESRVDPAEVDEGADVCHVKAVADLAVVGERAATKCDIDGSMEPRRSNRTEDCSTEERGEGGIEVRRAARDRAGADKSDGHGDEPDRQPSATAERNCVEPEREQTAHGDAVDMRERVCRSDPREMAHSEERCGDEEADEQRGEHPWRAQDADDGSPEKVVLLFDGERPRGANGRRQRDVEEIL